VHGHRCLISLAAYNLAPLPGGYVYLGPGQSNPCQCSTVGYSLISACAACQNRDQLECDHIMSSQSSWAYRTIFSLSLGGLYMWPTAHLLLFHSEFRGREPITFDTEFGYQVPKSCSRGNKCPSMGYSRCRGLFEFFLKEHGNNSTLQIENDWNASKSYAAGGENRPLMFSFLPPLPSTTHVSYRQS